MATHSITKIANQAGFGLTPIKAGHTRHDDPRIHVQNAQAGLQQLGQAQSIRKAVQEQVTAGTLGNDASPANNGAKPQGWAGMLKQNVASTVAAAGFMAVGLAPVGIAITAVSAAATAKQATSFTGFDENGDAIEPENYTSSYADEQEISSPPISPNAPQSPWDHPIAMVADEIGEEQLLADLREISPVETALMGQVSTNIEQLQEIELAQKNPTSPSYAPGLG